MSESDKSDDENKAELGKWKCEASSAIINKMAIYW